MEWAIVSRNSPKRQNRRHRDWPGTKGEKVGSVTQIVLPSDVDDGMIITWDATLPSNPRPFLDQHGQRRFSIAPKADLSAKKPAFPQRYILPKNLNHAVKQLSDGELDQLFKAASDEAKRRGRLPRTVATDSTPSSRRPPDLLTKRLSATDKSKRRKVDVAEVSLTRGQVNAVRSAFKAGVTPSRIARQFGLSQSCVRKALASDESNR